MLDRSGLEFTTSVLARALLLESKGTVYAQDVVRMQMLRTHIGVEWGGKRPQFVTSGNVITLRTLPRLLKTTDVARLRLERTFIINELDGYLRATPNERVTGFLKSIRSEYIFLDPWYIMPA